MFPGRRGAGRIFHTEVKLSGRRPAGVRAVRPERRRRRLHPGVLRRRDHARRQRLDVPRLAADGRDGDRREGDARGDGRGAHAHRRVRLRPLPRQVRRGGDRPRQALPELLPVELATRSRPRRRPPQPAARAAGHPGRREQAVRHARADRRAGGRRVVPRGPQALGEGADRRLRAARRARDRDRRQPAQAARRRAVRRLLRQGRALHLDLQRVQRPAAVPRRRARLHDRHRRSSARASSGHGAKMISAVSEATVPKLSVIVRKAYGAGLYAMAGPGLRPGRLHRAARRQDRGDGPAGGHQRRLLQPAPGDRGPRRARAPHRGAARRVQGGDRHPAPGVRAGHRRGGAAGRPARRPDQALRGLRLARPLLAGQAQPGHARLDRRGEARRDLSLGGAGDRRCLHGRHGRRSGRAPALVRRSSRRFGLRWSRSPACSPLRLGTVADGLRLGRAGRPGRRARVLAIGPALGGLRSRRSSSPTARRAARGRVHRRPVRAAATGARARRVRLVPAQRARARARAAPDVGAARHRGRLVHAADVAACVLARRRPARARRRPGAPR